MSKSTDLPIVETHYPDSIDSISTSIQCIIHLFQSPTSNTTSTHCSLLSLKYSYSSIYCNPNSSAFSMNIIAFSSYCESTIFYRNSQTQYSIILMNSITCIFYTVILVNSLYFSLAAI